jgi:hypothetical protein
MPRSLPGRQILRLCSAQRSLEIKVLANESSWAAVRQRLHCNSGRPKPKKGAKSSKVTRKQAELSEAYQQLPQLVWDVENPILWDAKSATVCQVAVAMLVAIFSSLRHETQLVGYQAAVQAGSSSWQQLLGLRPSEMKAKLNSEQQWKQLQQEAAVALFTNPPVRARLGAGGGAPAQQYEACMVVQQKQVCRWVPAAAAAVVCD